MPKRISCYISVLFLFLFAQLTHAAEAYQTEVGFGYLNTSDDFGGELDFFGITATYNLNPVDTSDVPLEEAAFLKRHSSIEFLLGQLDVSTPFLKADGPIYGLTFEFKSPNTLFSAITNVSKSNITADFIDSDTITYEVGAGAYVQAQTLISLEYQFSTTSFSEPGTPSDDTKVYTFSLKNVSQLSDRDQWLNFEALVSSSENDDGSSTADAKSVQAGLDYYFNRFSRASFTLSVINSDFIDFDGKSFLLGFGFFGGPRYMISAEFERFTADDGFIGDTDSISLTFTGRF